jgi:S-adenosylmethionine decarboxylase
MGVPGKDCWYLYTLGGGKGMQCRNNNKNLSRQDPDQTLEVLMSDLDPQVMAIFSKEQSSSAADATHVSNIHFHLRLHV